MAFSDATIDSGEPLARTMRSCVSLGKRDADRNKAGREGVRASIKWTSATTPMMVGVMPPKSSTFGARPIGSFAPHSSRARLSLMTARGGPPAASLLSNTVPFVTWIRNVRKKFPSTYRTSATGAGVPAGAGLRGSITVVAGPIPPNGRVLATPADSTPGTARTRSVSVSKNARWLAGSR